jgi:hypothetical protein
MTEPSTEYSVLQYRHYYEYNNDPQRRCYWGAHASTAFAWTAWGNLETFRWMKVGTDPIKIEERLKFWRELNAYAVSARGKGALTEYRVVSESEAYPNGIPE